MITAVANVPQISFYRQTFEFEFSYYDIYILYLLKGVTGYVR